MSKKWKDAVRKLQDTDGTVEPIKERPGICGNCSNGGFSLRIETDLIRTCKGCGEEMNTEKMEVIKHASK